MRNFARLLLRRFSKAGKPFDVLGRSWSRNRVAQGIGLRTDMFAEVSVSPKSTRLLPPSVRRTKKRGLPSHGWLQAEQGLT